MQHPFDGLIEPNSSTPDTPATTRRDVVKAGTVAGLAALVGAGRATADDRIEPNVDRAKHAAYVVVPKDFRSFRGEARTKLGVHGGYFRSTKSKDGKTNRTGFLAWLTEAEAVKVAADPAVVDVQRVTAADIPGPGKRPQRAQQVMVMLAPNGWKKAPEGTFASTDDLVAGWRKDFAKMADVKVTRGKPESSVLVNVGAGGMPEKLVATLKDHPQVVGLAWNGILTTQALGEEGATTKAVGEEGATTLRVGEEGGVTTQALGEEGGPRPSTRAAGEEGGPKPTTKRIGEEGGPKPSTRRLGEEGGPRPQPTTLALGEEGGPRRID